MNECTCLWCRCVVGYPTLSCDRIINVLHCRVTEEDFVKSEMGNVPVLVNKLARLTVPVKKFPIEGLCCSSYVNILGYHSGSARIGLNIDVVDVVTVIARRAHYKIQIKELLCSVGTVLIK